MQEVWTSSQLSLLEPLARRRTVKRGGVLFKAGQRDIGLTVVLRGEIQVVEQRDGIEQKLAVGHEPDFIGDVAMLQGTSALATARVTWDEAEILYVPAAELQRALAELPKVSKPIVDALIMRRRRCVAIASLQELRVLAARGAFASNIEQQTSSIPDYAAGKGTSFLFLPIASSPVCGRKFSSHEFNGALNYLPTGIQAKFVFDVFAVGLDRFHPQPQ